MYVNVNKVIHTLLILVHSCPALLTSHAFFALNVQCTPFLVCCMYYSCNHNQFVVGFPSLLSSLVTLFLIIVLVPSSVLILASELPVLDSEQEFACNVLL